MGPDLGQLIQGLINPLIHGRFYRSDPLAFFGMQMTTLFFLWIFIVFLLNANPTLKVITTAENPKRKRLVFASINSEPRGKKGTRLQCSKTICFMGNYLFDLVFFSSKAVSIIHCVYSSVANAKQFDLILLTKLLIANLWTK